MVTRAQNAQQAQQADPRGNARTNSSDRRNNVRTAQVGQRSRDGAAFRSDQRGNVRATQDNRRGDVRNNRVDNRNAVRRDSSRSNYRGDRNSYGNDRRDYRRWDRGWRSNRNYNWADYRRGNHFIYRPGAYYAPYRSHRYSRFHTGFYLNSVFFQQRFYINDPYAYRLPPAYAPYQWVRYYDDVVLVDIYTGEVVDVIHDFFW